jgi:hypothetical protein
MVGSIVIASEGRSEGLALPRSGDGREYAAHDARQGTALSISNLNDFGIRTGGGEGGKAIQGGFEAMYEQTANAALRRYWARDV